MLNPYSQGWQGAGGQSPSNGRPSIFGALPYPSADALPTFFSFRFTSFNPTVLNCTIIGPQSRPYFRIMTDAPMPGVSILQNANGQNIALVQWHRHPEVEIRNIITRQRTSEMLALSTNQRSVFGCDSHSFQVYLGYYSSRTMSVSGATLTFVPRDNFIWVRFHSARRMGFLMDRLRFIPLTPKLFWVVYQEDKTQ